MPPGAIETTEFPPPKPLPAPEPDLDPAAGLEGVEAVEAERDTIEAERDTLAEEVKRLIAENEMLRTEVDRRAERAAELSQLLSSEQTDAEAQEGRAVQAEHRERQADRTIERLRTEAAEWQALSTLVCRIAVDADGVLRVPGTVTEAGHEGDDDEDRQQIRALVRNNRTTLWREVRYGQTGEIAEAIDAIMRLRHRHRHDDTDEPVVDAEIRPWWDGEVNIDNRFNVETVAWEPGRGWCVRIGAVADLTSPLWSLPTLEALQLSAWIALRAIEQDAAMTLDDAAVMLALVWEHDAETVDG
jgi:cell division septum initiation protein DivIVA